MNSYCGIVVVFVTVCVLSMQIIVVTSSSTADTTESVTTATNLPSSVTVPSAPTVISSQTVPSAQTVPSGQTIPSAPTVPSSQTLPSAQTVPSGQTIPSGQTVPSVTVTTKQTTPAPINCKLGTCNETSTCIASIDKTCTVKDDGRCFTKVTNGTLFEVGCHTKTECDKITVGTTCCDAELCNNIEKSSAIPVRWSYFIVSVLVFVSLL